LFLHNTDLRLVKKGVITASDRLIKYSKPATSHQVLLVLFFNVDGVLSTHQMHFLP